jgi:hypothetical protein
MCSLHNVPALRILNEVRLNLRHKVASQLADFLRKDLRFNQLKPDLIART